MAYNNKNGKIKLLLVICAVLIVTAIFIRNIIPGVKDRKDGINTNENKNAEVEDKHLYISYGEVYDLVSYMSNSLMDKPDDSEKVFTCGDFHRLITEMCESMDIKYDTIKEILPERLSMVGTKDGLYVSEFFSVYSQFFKAAQIEEKELAFIGCTIPGDSENFYGAEAVMKDSLGEDYIFSYVRDYSDIFSVGPSGKYAEERFVTAKVCSKGAYRCLVKENHIICILEKSYAEYILRNVWLISGEEKQIHIFDFGFDIVIDCKYPLKGSIEDVVADITICNGVVTGVVAKSGKISGKVLRVEKDFIEIEGYGELETDEAMQIYKIYDFIELKSRADILVGYSNVEFVYVDGKICAALISSKAEARNIRVLIKNGGFVSNYHETAVLTSDTSFYTMQNGVRKEYKRGDLVTFTSDDVKNGRITIRTSNEKGKITIKSLNRTQGNPAYRGSIELAYGNGKIVIVNELSIEEYLYGVVPSEMPSSYAPEALKVQAVCARSYAVSQLMANKYAVYGANVDDSTSSQVYNNIAEAKEAIQAVNDTYGIILTYNNEPAQIYYFSTSCGHTADIEDVWEDGKECEYLKGKLQMEESIDIELNTEEDFRAFIDGRMVKLSYNGITIGEENPETFDSGYLMYRWSTVISKEDLKERIDKLLEGKSFGTNGLYLCTDNKLSDYSENTNIIKYNGKIYENAVLYGHDIPKTLGQIKSIKIIERGSGGIATKLFINGEKEDVIICFQYNIRNALAPINSEVIRSDGSTVSMGLLPSAFMYIDEEKEKFVIKGGGYGHGLGMSQNGANVMAKKGYTYKEILEHYFKGTNSVALYNNKE